MTETRARELAELTPPPSLSRLVLFLDDLGLRVGFETSFSALDTQLDGEGASPTQHHDIVAQLLGRRQIEPYEILEFSLWLRRWNERRVATETIRLDDVEKAPLGWDDDHTLWQSPDRPLFRPQFMAHPSDDFAEVRDVARTSSPRPLWSVNQAALAPVALPRVAGSAEEQAPSKTGTKSSSTTEVREIKVARSPDILDRAWTASREPEASPRSQSSLSGFSTFVEAGKSSVNSQKDAPRREGELPLAPATALAAPKTGSETSSSSSIVVSAGSSSPVLGEREAPVRRSKARDERAIGSVEDLPDAPIFRARRSLDTKASDSNSTLEPKAKAQTVGSTNSIEPTTARLSHPNTLSVLNRATWSVNAVGGSSLGGYIAGQMAAMPVASAAAPLSALNSPFGSSWTNPMPLSSMQRTPMEHFAGSATIEAESGGAPRFTSVVGSPNQRAQASIEVIEDEPAPESKSKRRIKRSTPAKRPFAVGVVDESGDAFLGAEPQTPARPAIEANPFRRRQLTPRVPISSPLEALRLPAPALAVDAAPQIGARTTNALATAAMSFLGVSSAPLALVSSAFASDAGPSSNATPARAGQLGGNSKNTQNTSALSALQFRPSLRTPPPSSDSQITSESGASSFVAPSRADDVKTGEVAPSGSMLAPARDSRMANRVRFGVPLVATFATATAGAMGHANASSLSPHAAFPASQLTASTQTFLAPAFSTSQQNSLEAEVELPLFPSRAVPNGTRVVMQGQNAPTGQEREAWQPVASGPARLAGLTLNEARWGQITLVAPPLRVASPEAEQGGANIAFSWSSLGASASALDENGVAQLKSVLPAGAQAIYPALSPGSNPNAMTVALAPTMVARLLENYNASDSPPTQRQQLARQLSDRGRANVGSSSASPVKAEIVPTAQRPAAQSSGIIPGQASAKSAGALQDAGQGQAKRGGALDFLGVPVRLAPSLGGRSELSDEVAVRHAADSAATPGAVRPQIFGALRDRLFPSISSTEAEPNRGAWEKAAPDFGLSNASPQTVLSPDSRVKKASPAESQPAPTTAPQSENAPFNSSTLARSQRFTPPQMQSAPALTRSHDISGLSAFSPSFSMPTSIGSIPTGTASVPTDAGSIAASAGSSATRARNNDSASPSSFAGPVSFPSPVGMQQASFSLPSLAAPGFDRGMATPITADGAPSHSGSPGSSATPIITGVAPSFTGSLGSSGAGVASEPIYSPPSLGRPQQPMKSRGQTLPAPTLGSWTSLEEATPAFSGADSSSGRDSGLGSPGTSPAAISMANRSMPFAADSPLPANRLFAANQSSDSLFSPMTSSLDLADPTPTNASFDDSPRAYSPMSRSSLVAAPMSPPGSATSVMPSAPTAPFARAPLRVFPAPPTESPAVTIQRSSGPVASPASAPASGGGKKATPGAGQQQGSGEDVDALANEVWSVLKRRLDFERQRRGY